MVIQTIEDLISEIDEKNAQLRGEKPNDLDPFDLRFLEYALRKKVAK